MGGARCRNLSFTLEEIISACPIPLDFWEFHWGRRSLYFGWVYFPSSETHIRYQWVHFPSPETHIRYQWVQNGCFLLLSWSHQHNVTNIMCTRQCDILWERLTIKIPSKSWHRSGELIHPVKVHCWPLKANCFWWSLRTGTEIKEFAKLIAAYHV